MKISIFVEGSEKHISVKFIIWTAGLGDVIKSFFLSIFSFGCHLIQWSEKKSKLCKV